MYRFQPFVDWVEEKGFYVRDSWDMEKGKWVGAGKLHLFPFQKKILGYCLTQDEDGKFPFETILYSTIKKSGKTLLSAAICAWFADQAPDGTEIYLIANAREQAESRAFQDLIYHYKHRIDLFGEKIRIVKYEIILPNETFIRVLPKSAETIAGSRHALVLFDEMWGLQSERDRRVWDEMTPIPTVPYSLRFLSTYAGFIGESELLWEVYLNGVGKEEHEEGKGVLLEDFDGLPCYVNGKMFTYWDHFPRLPWQTPEYFEEQLNQLRPAAYLRLHENRWVTTHESFVPIEWWDYATNAFEKPADYIADHPYRGNPVCIGIDGSTKEATTAVVGVTYVPREKKVAILFHKIWKPRQMEGGMDFESLEEYILDRVKKYHVISVGYDPTQLHQAMTHLARMGVPVHPVNPQSSYMIKASQTLYDLLRYRNLLAYPDDELRMNMMTAVAEDTGSGFRIVKTGRSRSPNRVIDSVIALAMACHDAIDRMGSIIDAPFVMEMPFSDVSAWRYENPVEASLPWEFRS